jgi:hypothetical protein
MTTIPSVRPPRAAISTAISTAAAVGAGVLGLAACGVSGAPVAGRATAVGWIVVLAAAACAGPRGRRFGALAALLLAAQGALHLCFNAAQTGMQSLAANPAATCASIPTATPGMIMTDVCTAGPHASPQPWVISTLILLGHVALALLSAFWLRYDGGALSALGRRLAARVAALRLWSAAPAAPRPVPGPAPLRRYDRRRPRIAAAQVCFPVGRRGPPAVCAAR